MIPDSNIQGYATKLSSPGGFEPGRINFPAVPMVENWSMTIAKTATVYCYDGRTDSPTYGTYINFPVNYNVTYRTKSAAGVKQNVQPLTLHAQPGLKKHRLFCNFVFGQVIDYEKYQPIGDPTTHLDNFVQPHFLANQWQWTALRQISYDGILNGRAVVWFNGQRAGEIPIATGSAGTDKTVVTQFVSPDGSALLQKNGGLEYLCNFDGKTRQLPEITFNGNCDMVTIELSATYKNSGAQGEFFAGLLSMN